MDSGKKDIQFKHLIKINVDDAVTGFTNKNVLSHHLNPSVEIACQILSRIFFNWISVGHCAAFVSCMKRCAYLFLQLPRLSKMKGAIQKFDIIIITVIINMTVSRLSVKTRLQEYYVLLRVYWMQYQVNSEHCIVTKQ